MAESRWRKDRDESKERDILIEGVIMGLAETDFKVIPRNPQG